MACVPVPFPALTMIIASHNHPLTQRNDTETWLGRNPGAMEHPGVVAAFPVKPVADLNDLKGGQRGTQDAPTATAGMHGVIAAWKMARTPLRDHAMHRATWYHGPSGSATAAPKLKPAYTPGSHATE